MKIMLSNHKLTGTETCKMNYFKPHAHSGQVKLEAQPEKMCQTKGGPVWKKMCQPKFGQKKYELSNELKPEFVNFATLSF